MSATHSTCNDISKLFFQHFFFPLMYLFYQYLLMTCAHLHFMYDNSEQLFFEAVIEHWDKFFSPPLQSIVPENTASLLFGGTAFWTRELSFLYPSWPQTTFLALFDKLLPQTFFFPLSVMICTKPSFGRDEFDRDTSRTSKQIKDNKCVVLILSVIFEFRNTRLVSEVSVKEGEVVKIWNRNPNVMVTNEEDFLTILLIINCLNYTPKFISENLKLSYVLQVSVKRCTSSVHWYSK